METLIFALALTVIAILVLADATVAATGGRSLLNPPEPENK
jgi:hypothetical protein